MIGLHLINSSLISTTPSPSPTMLSSTSPPKGDITPFTSAAAKSVDNSTWENCLTHSELSFWKHHLHCVRNSITTVTLTNEHRLSINSQHTSTAKPWQQEKKKKGMGELNAAELSQKGVYTRKELTSLFTEASSAFGNPQRVYHAHINGHSQRLKQCITHISYA